MIHPTEEWNPDTWISIKRLGSHQYFVSRDGRFFFKKFSGSLNELQQEYNNLRLVSHIDLTEGLRFLRPIAALPTLDVLVTEYVDGTLLANIRDPEVFYSFGQKLRSFHDSGHTHSHLQINDIIYAGGSFVVADLAFMDEEPSVHDLVLFKLSCQIFRLKRPWRWASYNQCYAAFREGYGFKEDCVFQERTHHLLKRWMMRLRKRSFQDKWLGVNFLRLAIATRMVG